MKVFSAIVLLMLIVYHCLRFELKNEFSKLIEQNLTENQDFKTYI